MLLQIRYAKQAVLPMQFSCA